MMDLLVRRSCGQCEFIDGSQAAILRRDFVARRFAIPKGQQIQTGNGKVFATPSNVYSDDVDISLSHLGEPGDHINEVLKSANIAGVRIVHPTVDINEKQRALRLADRVDRSHAL
jgi:hypothetical protein